MSRRISELTDLLNQLYAVSEQILESGSLITDYLAKNADEIADVLIERCKPKLIGKEKAFDLLQKAAENILTDALLVRDQLEPFTNAIADNTLGEDTKECEYLASVWSGDMYDATGTKALNLLLDDLSEQLHIATLKTVLERAKNNS
jgi:hypothetical protein